MEGLVDARFGFDGGRQAHMVNRTAHASARPRDVLVLAALLGECVTQVRDVDDHGPRALLPPIPQCGGGTTQGLSSSGCAYTTLPLDCEDRVACEVPSPCVSMLPEIRAAFEATYDGDLMDMHALWPEDIQTRAYRIEKALESLRAAKADPTAVYAEILRQFRRCASDSERLWLVDLLAPESERWATLFIDDAGFPASSPAAAVIMTRPLHDYNVHNGVVFEAGQPQKTRFLMDGVPDAVMAACQTAIEGSILGGSPAVVAATRVLGLPPCISTGHLGEPLQGRRDGCVEP